MGWHSQSCEVYSCFNLRRIYAPQPCYTVRCQGHKSLHYVWRIAVLSLTKKELHPFMAKTWYKISHLGNFFPTGEKKNVGSKISHTIVQQFDLKKKKRASLVVQWLRVCLPMQGTRVRALVWEDPTCRRATKPVRHNCWACASGACAPQQERPR